ncbi:hypothetical protein NC653_023905 [Populus alba x Populus x berolinensis]|uniref:Pentatricopeptide repeat-containing protein n=1 Tax=Populus alba x Populus x berolinensis TaxID=444605 RepID=A0AAD6QBM3_9ROSI|nr:hypothetical protein NC653_023905 [Populus alba x Populus x berolinensis]
MVACHLVPCLYRWNWLLYILCEEKKLHEAYRVCDVMFERGFLPGDPMVFVEVIVSYSSACSLGVHQQGHALRGLGSESDVSHDKMVIIGRLSTSTKMEFYMQDSSKRVICYSSPSEVSWHPLTSAAANTKCGCLPWCELEKGLALGGFLCNMPFQFLISILSGELLTENSIL